MERRRSEPSAHPAFWMRGPIDWWRRRRAEAEKRAQLKEALAEFARGMTQLRLLDEVMRVGALIERKRLPEATALIRDLLPKLSPDQADERLTLQLNLAYLLAVSIEARGIVSPDRAMPEIEAALAALAVMEGGLDHGMRHANALNNAASVQLACDVGEPGKMQQRAIAAYDEAIAIYRALGPAAQNPLGQTLINRAEAYRRVGTGDFANSIRRAIASAEEALEILWGDSAGEARAYSLLGLLALADQGDLPRRSLARALDHVERAASRWQACGADANYVEERINIGTVRLATARLSRERPMLDEALAILDETYSSIVAREHDQLLVRVGIELINARATLAEWGVHDEALFADTAAVEHRLIAFHHRIGAPSTANAPVLAAVARFLMAVARGSGDTAGLDEAQERVDAACAAWERSRSVAPQADLLVELASTLDMLGTGPRVTEAYAAAVAISGRLRNLAVSLTSGHLLSANLYRAANGYAALLAADGAAYAAVSILEGALARSLSPADCGPASDERRTLLAALERMDRKAAASSRTGEAVDRLKALAAEGGVDARSETRWDAETLAKSLPAEFVIIYPLAGPSGERLLCLGRSAPGDVPWTEILACDGMGAATAEVITSLPTDGAFTPEASVQLAASLRHLGDSIGPALAAVLEARGMGGDTTLCIVNHGHFAELPWSAISWEAANGVVHLDALGRLSVVPSLAWILSRTQGESGGGSALIADPTEDLPGARIEQRMIAAVLGDSDCLSLVGEQATCRAVEEALGASAHVHLAAHSHFDQTQPFQSALCLSDGDLSLSQLIAGAGPPPRLILLSSCSSAAGNALQASTEGWSFPWVFHRWGVDRVIASLWAVSDLAMLLLFGIFYEQPGWAAAPEQALMRARAGLRTMSGSAARDRLDRLVGHDTAERRELLAELERIERRFGPAAPFASPLLWAPLVLSGFAPRHEMGSKP